MGSGQAVTHHHHHRAHVAARAHQGLQNLGVTFLPSSMVQNQLSKDHDNVDDYNDYDKYEKIGEKYDKYDSYDRYDTKENNRKYALPNPVVTANVA